MIGKIANVGERKERRDRFEADVRRLLKGLLPRKKRAEIAASLTVLMGREITKSMLDNFTAEGKCEPRLPLSIARALCEVLAEAPDISSLRRFLNSAEDTALLDLGGKMLGAQKLFERIAQQAVNGKAKRKR